MNEYAGEPSPNDLAYLQRKISAAGEMKTAIKKFLDTHDCGNGSCGHMKKLQEAMEGYLNVQ